MEENNVVTNVEAVDNDLAAYEPTDLAPVEVVDSKDGIDAGSIALGALAVVGAGFLIKKTIDGGKWVISKVKGGVESLKEKKAAKADGKAESEEAEDPEAEAEETTEEKTSKEKGKK